MAQKARSKRRSEIERLIMLWTLSSFGIGPESCQSSFHVFLATRRSCDVMWRHFGTALSSGRALFFCQRRPMCIIIGVRQWPAVCKTPMTTRSNFRTLWWRHGQMCTFSHFEFFSGLVEIRVFLSFLSCFQFKMQVAAVISPLIPALRCWDWKLLRKHKVFDREGMDFAVSIFRTFWNLKLDRIETST